MQLTEYLCPAVNFFFLFLWRFGPYSAHAFFFHEASK